MTHNITTKLIKLANPHVGDVLIENEILLLPSRFKKQDSFSSSKQGERQECPIIDNYFNQEETKNSDCFDANKEIVRKTEADQIQLDELMNEMNAGSRLASQSQVVRPGTLGIAHPRYSELHKRRTVKQISESNLKSTVVSIEQKFEQLQKDFEVKRKQDEEQKQSQIVSFLRDKMASRSELSKLDTQKLACILEGHSEVSAKAEVYYCTQEGRVYGELQIGKRKVFFEPVQCPENEKYISVPKNIRTKSMPNLKAKQ
jgi:hypothetical protein